MFSTLMSLEDRLRLKLKVKANMYGYNAGPPMAITVYQYTQFRNRYMTGVRPLLCTVLDCGW